MYQVYIFQDYYKRYIQVVVEWITMVYCCSSNPGTNIGKPVFTNDPNILFMLMFKTLFFYSINTIFLMEWNEMINGQKLMLLQEGMEILSYFLRWLVTQDGTSVGATNKTIIRDDDKPRKGFLANKIATWYYNWALIAMIKLIRSPKRAFW